MPSRKLVFGFKYRKGYHHPHRHHHSKTRLVWLYHRRMVHGTKRHQQGHVWKAWTPATGRIYTVTNSPLNEPLPGCGALRTIAEIAEHLANPVRRPLLPLPDDLFRREDQSELPAIEDDSLIVTDPASATGLSWSGLTRSLVPAKIVKRVRKRSIEHVHYIASLPPEDRYNEQEAFDQATISRAVFAARQRTRQIYRSLTTRKAPAVIVPTEPEDPSPFDSLDLAYEEGRVVRRRKKPTGGVPRRQFKWEA